MIKKEIHIKDLEYNIYFNKINKIELIIDNKEKIEFINDDKDKNYKEIINKCFIEYLDNKEKIWNKINRNSINKTSYIMENEFIYDFKSIYNAEIEDNNNFICEYNVTNFLINLITYYIVNYKKEDIDRLLDIFIKNTFKKCYEYEDNTLLKTIYKFYYYDTLFNDLYMLNLNIKIKIYGNIFNNMHYIGEFDENKDYKNNKDIIKECEYIIDCSIDNKLKDYIKCLEEINKENDKKIKELKKENNKLMNENNNIKLKLLKYKRKLYNIVNIINDDEE